jgi:hypothetical protein
VERAKETEMWKELEKNMGDRRGGKSVKGKKERKKEGEGLRHKRSHSLLNLNELYTR